MTVIKMQLLVFIQTSQYLLIPKANADQKLHSQIDWQVSIHSLILDSSKLNMLYDFSFCETLQLWIK